MNLLKQLLPAIALIAFMSGAITAQADPFYLTANAGASRLKNFCSNTATGFDCKNTTLAYGLDAGYQFNEIFGLELGYGKEGSPQTSGTLFGSTLKVIQDISAAKLAATLGIQVNNSFAFIGKLGAARISSAITATNNPGPPILPYTAYSTSLLYGLGIRYSFNDAWALRIQYENIGKVGDENTGTDSLALLTAGITYSFGKARSRTSTNTPPPKQQKAETKTPTRVILFLDQSVPNDRQHLTAAVSEACLCTAIFVRLYNSTSLVYQVELPDKQGFTAFKNALQPQHGALGIKGIMQGQ